MKKSENGPVFVTVIAIIVVVAAPGCASKKYVNQQIKMVNQQAAQNQKETNGKVAWLTNKEHTDVAQMNERITGTDQKLSAVNDRITATDQKLAEAADADHGSAARSADETIVNSTVMNALNYQLVDKADVMFGFNKAILTPAAMAALDTIVAKVQETPRAVVELAGFTDQVGSPNYNLELSRRRAWAVQRYLVEHNVPTRAIHVVGLGEEKAPEGTESTVHKMSHRKSSGNGAERRVNIRVFGPGESAASSSGQ